MGAGPSNPTALKRWLVFTLRRLREENGLSRDDAARAIRASVKVVEHYEVGRRLPSPLALEKLLELYGVPERTDFYLDLLSRAKKGRDWWARFDFDTDATALPSWFKLFLSLEAEAARIEGWDAQVVPGLFQTEQYAEAVIRAGSDDLADSAITRQVALRAARRQQTLERSGTPVKVWRVIHENALRLPVGGDQVLRDQLEFLLRLLERPSITVQVLPTAAGAHPGIAGSFSFLSFDPELEDPGLVHVDTHVRSIYYERPEDLVTYRTALRRLTALAMPPEETPTTIAKILKEL
ncbi:helix-turn-helix domain-containing protein [Saccharopolyspora hordei]|uniref:Transcriptional regulator with XRE-family HTH domain n=1 Tax=Saccharopolyspora hordei TaxID=1838 RepID=A0A853AKE8_9PSEU|nr:helix-turn-helix transcriptional regulator [Saccharopolyspora hordei]NYI85164.1 transcriptional regulator with XRE-family HTH domain [Saccharopolyspora hordei]